MLRRLEGERERCFDFLDELSLSGLVWVLVLVGVC